MNPGRPGRSLATPTSGRSRLARVGVVAALLASAGCDRSPPPPPAATPHAANGTHTFGASDEVSAQAAVDDARAILQRAGLPVALIFRSTRALGLGPLLPMQHTQLPADAPLRALLAPLRDHIRPLAERCAPGGVCVVLVAEIAPASSAAAALLPDLAGLAVGPLVFQHDQDARGPLSRAATAMGWPGGEGPNVVLLSARHLRQREAAGRTALVLHEVGHALGLRHSVDGDDGDDVMTPSLRARGATPGMLRFSAEQVAAARRGLTTLAASARRADPERQADR